MHQSTALPELRVLPTISLIPHEDYDPRRAEKLSRRILEEGILKNPPIVTVISPTVVDPGCERYVVLDGANRTMAFAAAGIPHIVAQLVTYNDPGVILDTWYHVVSGLDLELFEEGLSKIKSFQLQACSLDTARRALEVKEAMAYIVCEDGVRMVVSVSGQQIPTMQVLRDIVGLYHGRADVFRASNDIWEIQKPFYPDITSLVIFPRLQPTDILAAAENGEKVPSGITRHIIPARALNINIPIGILMADWSEGRKREWLHDWLMSRMGANAIRFYAESTFSFNE
jgi:hypothetical protein